MNGTTLVSNLGNNDSITGRNIDRGSGGKGQLYIAYSSACTNSTTVNSYSLGSGSFQYNEAGANTGTGGYGLPSSSGRPGGSGFAELRYPITFPPLSNHGTASYTSDANYHMYFFSATKTFTV